MPGRVEELQEILIDDVRYPVEGDIRRFLASRPTARMTIGPAQATAHQDLSYIAWDDPRGGIGIERMDPDQDGDRSWFSTCTLRQKRHLTLPALATRTAASGVTGSFTVGTLNERDNVIFGAFGDAVRSYTSSTDSWGSTLRTLAAGATHSLNIRLGGTEYILFAYDSGYDYYNGTSWATSAKDVRYLAFWRDRLWGIDSTGQLWWATTLGTEVNDAQLPLPNGTVTNLFVGRSPTGALILYAATTNGLFAHDFDNQRFTPTELELPFHPDNGLGATRWRDSSYISAGLSIYKYVNGVNAAIITPMGPDRDHGLPSNYRGRIRRLIPTLNGLIALIDATTAVTVSTMFMSDAPTNSEVISPDAGQSAILEYDNQGWQILWTSAADTLPVTVAHISNAYNDYRIWWAQDQRVYHMTIPRDLVNPNQISDRVYAASSSHEFPWVDADETNLDKVAAVVGVYVLSASAAETIAVRLRLNDDDTVANQTTLGTIIAVGHTEYILPNTTAPAGTAFRTAKLVLDLARGSTTTLTPDVARVEFYFIRKEAIRWGTSVTIIIPPAGYKDQSAQLMYENMIAAVAAALQVEVVWRSLDADDVGTANPYNYYMDIVQHTGTEQSGFDYSGKHTLTMLER